MEGKFLADKKESKNNNHSKSDLSQDRSFLVVCHLHIRSQINKLY